jgi:hypothetical protein
MQWSRQREQIQTIAVFWGYPDLYRGGRRHRRWSSKPWRDPPVSTGRQLLKKLAGRRSKRSARELLTASAPGLGIRWQQHLYERGTVRELRLLADHDLGSLREEEVRLPALRVA